MLGEEARRRGAGARPEARLQRLVEGPQAVPVCRSEREAAANHDVAHKRLVQRRLLGAREGLRAGRLAVQRDLWVLAAKAGLGFYLRSASNNIDAAAMFASLIVLSLLATTLALAVRVAHHRTVFWKYRRH